MNGGSLKTDLDGKQRSLILKNILMYLVWFLFCGLTFWAIWLVRTNLIEDIFFMKLDPWQLRAVDRWSIWVMGAIWVVGIFLAEGYLRKGIEKERLWNHIVKLLAVPGVLIALSYLIHAI